MGFGKSCSRSAAEVEVEEVVLTKEVRISCCCLITPDEGCSIGL